MKERRFDQPSRRRPLRFVIALAVAILTLSILACSTLIPPIRATATPTPTGQIGAVEIGTLSGNKRDWQIWAGTITSTTSRKFMNPGDGTQVNQCETDWILDLDFAVDSAGTVSGMGDANLSTGPTCSPVTITGNTTNMKVLLHGRKDQNAFYLDLGVNSFQPMPSGDFGGFMLLMNNGACPPVKHDNTIPLTSPTTAANQLNLSGTMTGCGGSAQDQVSNQSNVNLRYRFKCSEIPADMNDPLLKQLCQ
jgi:hypothetical protein